MRVHSLCIFILLGGALISMGSSSPLVSLPKQFYVTVGTTIPFEVIDPVAQTGAIFVDSIHRKFRVDTFWMDMSRSIVVDFERGYCFVLQNHDCKAMKIGGGKHSGENVFGVPEGFVQHAELFNVRGVPVRRFSGVERGEYLQQVDYYVRNMTWIDPRVVLQHESDVPTAIQMPILWRIETQRSRRKEIRAAPASSPNWRFFGQPLNELVTLDEPLSSAVEQVIADVPIVVDFYNFVPMQPDPNVFVMPATCEYLTEELGRDVDVFSAQRLLVDLSFHSVHGRKFMESIWERSARQAQERSEDSDEL